MSLYCIDRPPRSPNADCGFESGDSTWLCKFWLEGIWTLGRSGRLLPAKKFGLRASESSLEPGMNKSWDYCEVMGVSSRKKESGIWALAFPRRFVSSSSSVLSVIQELPPTNDTVCPRDMESWTDASPLSRPRLCLYYPLQNLSQEPALEMDNISQLLGGMGGAMREPVTVPDTYVLDRLIVQ